MCEPVATAGARTSRPGQRANMLPTASVADLEPFLFEALREPCARGKVHIREQHTGDRRRRRFGESGELVDPRLQRIRVDGHGHVGSRLTSL